jgi:hypothetical protein
VGADGPTAGDATGGPALGGGKGLVCVIGAAGETRVVKPRRYSSPFHISHKWADDG